VSDAVLRWRGLVESRAIRHHRRFPNAAPLDDLKQAAWLGVVRAVSGRLTVVRSVNKELWRETFRWLNVSRRRFRQGGKVLQQVRLNGQPIPVKDNIFYDLKGALMRLPARERTIVEMIYRGHSVKEIAAALSAPHSTVSVARDRAYARLRCWLTTKRREKT